MVFKSKEGVAVETVVFNGKRYNRYPESSNAAHRRYFSRSGARLHRDVWIHHNGVIPDGHHVHHIDGDTGNNDIANLKCLPARQHRDEHKAELSARNKSDRQLRHLESIRGKAAEWHSSAEGVAWHKKHVAESLAKAWSKPKVYPELAFNCKWCGKQGTAKVARKVLCGSSCQTAESKFRLGKSSHEHPYHAASVRSNGSK